MGSHSVFSHNMSWDHNLTLINWKFYFEGQEAAFGINDILKSAAKWTYRLCTNKLKHYFTVLTDIYSM